MGIKDPDIDHVQISSERISYMVAGNIGILISPVMNVTAFPERLTRSPLILHDILPPYPIVPLGKKRERFLFLSGFSAPHIE